VLSDAVIVHEGTLPALLLPGGGVDLLLVARRPKEAGHDVGDIIVLARRERGIEPPLLRGCAVRLALEVGVFRVVSGLPSHPPDGFHYPCASLRALLAGARGPDDTFSAERAVELLSEKTESAGSLVGQRLRAAREIVSIARGSAGIRTVHDWAGRAGISTRTLERTLCLGGDVTPKSFLRCLRLDRTVAALAGPARLTDVADMTGFSDQSHMTRELREMTGRTPAGLRAEVRSGKIHIRESW
jgi:AraC-like DNA-binding protein